MTMTGQQLYPMGELTFDDLVDVYREQAQALYDAGVDLFIVETMMSLQETRACVLAIKEVCDLPIMATLTFEKDGRTLYGTPRRGAAGSGCRRLTEPRRRCRRPELLDRTGRHGGNGPEDV